MQDNDQISRTALLNDLTYAAPELMWDKEYVFYKILHQRTVDAVPVVHGRWIEDRTDIVCSVCGARYKDEIVFMPDVYVNGKRYDGLEHCPHCGARMDGGELNDT